MHRDEDHFCNTDELSKRFKEKDKKKLVEKVKADPNWKMFDLGEEFELKGYKFVIRKIQEKNLVLGRIL